MRREKKLAAGVLCLALLSAASVTGCGKKDEAQQTASVLDDGVLTVGIIDGRDAYARKVNGDFTGIEPQIVKRAGSMQELLVEFKEVSGEEELLALLDSGDVDLAAGRLTRASMYADGRLQSRNYAKRGIYLVTEKGLYADTLAGFSDVSVAVSAQIPSDTLLDVPYLEQVQQIPCTNAAEIGTEIKKGTVKAALLTEREALSLLSAGEVQASELRNSPRMEAVFCASAGQEALISLINEATVAFLDDQAQGISEEEQAEPENPGALPVSQKEEP